MHLQRPGVDSFRNSVQYAYGNMEYRKSNWLAARRFYSDALRIANAETPIHPITAAAYFSLGCAEFKLKHDDIAM